MSDQNETIAEILADYRADIPAMTSGELPHPTPEYLRILLDRIAAAAERERDAVKASAGMSCELCERLGPARFGDAAAIRAALNAIVDIAEDAFGGPEREREASQGRAISLIVDAALAALSAPARNCDRFNNATEAGLAYRNFLWERAGRVVDIDENMFFANLVNWLFATAEGGAKCVNGLRGDPDCRGCEEHCLDVRKRDCSPLGCPEAAHA